MPADPPPAGSPADWLRHAGGDRAIAQARRRRGWLYEHQCFLAQQAAEKAIKAVLVHNKITVPRSHDLAFLLAQLPRSVPVTVELLSLPILTKYAVELRYPKEAVPPSKSERHTAVQLAAAAVQWAAKVCCPQ